MVVYPTSSSTIVHGTRANSIRLLDDFVKSGRNSGVWRDALVRRRPVSPVELDTLKYDVPTPHARRVRSCTRLRRQQGKACVY